MAARIFAVLILSAAAGNAAAPAPGDGPADATVKPSPPKPAEGLPKPAPVLVFPRPGLTGKKIHLPKGVVTLGDALRLLADVTGLPVSLEVEAGRPAGLTAAKIELASEIREAGEEEALFLLEALRQRTWRDTFPGGRKVIRVAAVSTSGKAPSPSSIAPRPERKAKKVHITEGSVRLADLARLLSDLTGFPLLLDSSDPTFALRDIVITADIADADEEMVEAILEVNRVRSYQETLPSGKVILHVEPMAPATPAPEDPRPLPIIIVPK